jgi:hypothetical protein
VYTGHLDSIFAFYNKNPSNKWWQSNIPEEPPPTWLVACQDSPFW